MQNFLPIAAHVPDTPRAGHKACCTTEFKFFCCNKDIGGQPKLGDAAKRDATDGDK
jgi:hypothetical protein